MEFDEADQQNLMALKERRNRIEHHLLNEERRAIESVVIRCLNVIVRFVNREFVEFAYELAGREAQLLNEIRKKLELSERVVGMRERDIVKSLKEANPHAEPLPCPSCLRETMKADVEVECYYCGYKADASQAALRYSASLVDERLFLRAKWAPTPLNYRCPECTCDTLVHLGEGGGEGSREFLCFNCGYDWPERALELCGLCGQPSECDLFGGDRCRDCWEDYVRQDYT